MGITTFMCYDFLKKSSSLYSNAKKLSFSFSLKCEGDSSVLEAARFLGTLQRISLLLMKIDSSPFSLFTGLMLTSPYYLG